MPALRRKQPSAAKSRFHHTAVMYGLKLAAARQAVPFREASFSATCLVVKRADPLYGTAEPVPFVESLPYFFHAPVQKVKAKPTVLCCWI